MTLPRGAGLPPGLRCAVWAGHVLATIRPGALQGFLTVLSRGARPAETDELVEIVDRLERAGGRIAGWRGCLPRSIAVCLVARARGTWPDSWCAGVHRSAPFSAHAWVEHAGTIVGEPEAVGAYRALVRVDRPERT